jgi:hypothetical protein
MIAAWEDCDAPTLRQANSCGVRALPWRLSCYRYVSRDKKAPIKDWRSGGVNRGGQKTKAPGCDGYGQPGLNRK